MCVRKLSCERGGLSTNAATARACRSAKTTTSGPMQKPALKDGVRTIQPGAILLVFCNEDTEAERLELDGWVDLALGNGAAALLFCDVALEDFEAWGLADSTGEHPGSPSCSHIADWLLPARHPHALIPVLIRGFISPPPLPGADPDVICDRLFVGCVSGSGKAGSRSADLQDLDLATSVDAVVDLQPPGAFNHCHLAPNLTCLP